MIKKYPAIVVIAYNRVDSLKRLLASIAAAEYPDRDIKLIISIDYSDSLDAVKAVANDFTWVYGEKIIRVFDSNQGLKKHVLSCGDYTIEYGSIIMLEDDLYVSKDFYLYSTEALFFYHNADKIAGISLYSHAWNSYAGYRFMPMSSIYTNYFGQFSITWGQAWNMNQWVRFKNWLLENEQNADFTEVDLPDRVQLWGDKSWGKFFFKFIVKNDLYYVIPYVARSTNFSDAGVHASQTSEHQVELQYGTPKYLFAEFSNAAVRYDAFFERIFPGEIEGIATDRICVDLNGIKHIPKNVDYLLTCRDYKLDVKARYGMLMKPIDANVINKVPGDEIKLYRLDESCRYIKFKKHPIRIERMKYDIAGYWWFDFFPFVFEGFVNQIRSTLLKVIRRK